MNKTSLLTVLLSLFWVSTRIEAQVNTLYYMENVPARNNLNAAFIPTQKFYIDLPVISGTVFSVGNNSVTAQNIVVKQGNELVSALQRNNDYSPFLNILKSTTNITSAFRTNLLGCGFRTNKGYVTFGISERYQLGINIPKSAVSLLLEGEPDPLSLKSYNLKKIGCDMTAYLEMAMGYSKKLNNEWTIGAKAKILFGQAHANLSFSKLGIDVSSQSIDLYGEGNARITVPVTVSQRSNGSPYIQKKDVTVESMLHPVGLGLSVDGGVTYQYDKNLQLSAAIDDIGFIRWKKSNWKATLKSQTSYNSWDFTVNNTTGSSWTQIADSLKESYTSTFDNNKAYFTTLTATTYLGADYSLLKKKVVLGLLLTNTFGGRYRYHEITTSANFRPVYWFNTSISYSIVYGNWATIGWGLNLIGGPVNFFVVTDYLPLSYTSNGIPYKSKYVNGHVGISLTFREKKRKSTCHCE